MRVSLVTERPIVFILFSDLDRHGGMFKHYEKLLILSVFGQFDMSSQDFGWVLGLIEFC